MGIGQLRDLDILIDKQLGKRGFKDTLTYFEPLFTSPLREMCLKKLLEDIETKCQKMFRKVSQKMAVKVRKELTQSASYSKGPLNWSTYYLCSTFEIESCRAFLNTSLKSALHSWAFALLQRRSLISVFSSNSMKNCATIVSC